MEARLIRGSIFGVHQEFGVDWSLGVLCAFEGTDIAWILVIVLLTEPEGL